MRRETLADGIDLYLADCREVLPTLAKADAIVTDPPYELTSGGDTESHRSLGGWLGKYNNDGKPVACDISWRDVMQLLFAAIDAGDVYVMVNDKNVLASMISAAEAGFGFHNLLVWDKRTAVMNRWYMKNCEFCLYLWKGKARTIRDPSSKALCTVANLTDGIHPTQKPVELMAYYVCNSSDIGDLILDPFMGSGSTGVACARFGRRFVGIESETKHFDRACKRIADELREPLLLNERATKRRQEEMFHAAG